MKSRARKTDGQADGLFRARVTLKELLQRVGWLAGCTGLVGRMKGELELT